MAPLRLTLVTAFLLCLVIVTQVSSVKAIDVVQAKCQEHPGFKETRLGLDDEVGSLAEPYLGVLSAKSVGHSLLLSPADKPLSVEATDDIHARYHPMGAVNGPVPLIGCGSACGYRCIAAAPGEKACFDACVECCNKCRCVPSWTSGHNKEECPCYNDPKCP
ncbi:hypothetical protein Syun_006433 [Stephania yunnanensis]|uniref:Uncharacterized protein n=1 Tax=Stephania yunnanensis TaxID=152371 RepID=A0AAP0KWJ0_9MAGN